MVTIAESRCTARPSGWIAPRSDLPSTAIPKQLGLGLEGQRGLLGLAVVVTARLIGRGPVVVVAAPATGIGRLVICRVVVVVVVVVGRSSRPHLVGERLADELVERFAVDVSQCPLDRRYRRGDQASAARASPQMQAQAQLVGKVGGPLGDLGRVVVPGEHRNRAHDQDRRKLVANALGLSVIGQRAQLGEQPGLAVDHDLVQVDHVRLPVRSGAERWVIKARSEKPRRVGPQRVEPANLAVAVIDPRPVAPAVARGLTSGPRSSLPDSTCLRDERDR